MYSTVVTNSSYLTTTLSVIALLFCLSFISSCQHPKSRDRVRKQLSQKKLEFNNCRHTYEIICATVDITFIFTKNKIAIIIF